MSDRRPETRGTPYAPHTAADTAAMLSAVGVDSEADLFDVPESVAFEGAFGIEARSERAVRREVRSLLGRNGDLVEFLGRGHYAHYVPAVVDDLAGRSEFLTSYTQYQPEVTQGFLQALFEYQSLVAELTGLPVANASMYDAATALGEAALLADRVREASGSTVLVPAHLRASAREVLETYVAGATLSVESFPMDDGAVDVAALHEQVDEETLLVYAETPTVRGVVEERLAAVGEAAHAVDALFCVGSDLVALALLRAPGEVGADVVVGSADVLGLGTTYGAGLGIFATREAFLRQLPGRLVGASTDAEGRRAYTLTLQTREQHIRKERATSNICTNQAWFALQTAMHATLLGPSGLVDLAEGCVRDARDLAARLDDLEGVEAPVHDRHHLREFVVRTDRPAPEVAGGLRDRGFAVHVIQSAADREELLQVCVTDVNAHATDDLVAAFAEVAP
ncbi:MAG: aminomethyl-transferring glycine dehydrogenase subunit GcvPA [Haloferacaceae archaeon]